LPSHADETFLAVPALQVLDGHLPANAGPEYFGAAPSYLLAVWFHLAGSSTVANDIYAYGVSLLIFWTGWLVLRRFMNRAAAVLGLAVLATPPLFLVQWSFTTSGTHPTLLILGNLCLLATHTIVVAVRGRRNRAVLVLGLLAGLGWWTNPLIVVYLAPFCLHALWTGLMWRPSVLLFPLGLLIGGLPGWLYEAVYFPSARFALHQSGTVGALPFRERLVTVIGEFLPRIVDLNARAQRPWLTVALVIVAALWGLALVRAAGRGVRALARMAAGNARSVPGDTILWIVVALNLALVLATKRSIGAYYLLPLYSVIPCWMGEALDWLRRRTPVGAAVTLACFMTWHVSLVWHDSLAATPPEHRRWAELERTLRPLAAWLATHGIQNVYWSDMDAIHPSARMSSFEVTYLAGRQFIAADLWREHIVTHGRLVDAAAAPAIVATEPALSRLRAGLPALGLEVRETQVGEVRVLETEPRFTTTFVPLHRERWTATATLNPDQAPDLLDGDAASGWNAGRPQTPGQWLAVDLGAPELVSRVDLLAIDWQNAPAGLRVEVSVDARHWDAVTAVPDYWGPLFFSEYHAFLRVRRGRVQAIFPPVRARHVRMIQTGTASRGWAGRELFVYGPGGPRPSVPRPGEVTAALRREGIDFVYANHWLSAWVRVDSGDTIGALDSNINVNDYSRTEPDPTELLPPRLTAGTAFLLGTDADPGAVNAALKGQPVAVRESTAGPYPLLVLTPIAPPHHLDKKDWRVSASENAEIASRVADDDRRTRWVSSSAGSPALSVTLDLGRPRELGGVEVRPGLPGRTLRLAASLDGITWTAIDALTWAGSLYWTGSELLKNGGPKWAVAFPRTSLRYLRLSPATSFSEPWTLAELDALE
jgi:F5/8 type C domain-containing protein/dolichyl-phosphate-mannose-protein mannosyltransferase